MLERLEANAEAAWDRYHRAVQTSAARIEERGGEENVSDDELALNRLTLGRMEAIAVRYEKELSDYRARQEAKACCLNTPPGQDHHPSCPAGLWEPSPR